MSKSKDNTIKFKVQPGMICTFDSGNVLKQKDIEISHVAVLKMVKHRAFGKSVWLVQNADNPRSEPFTCDERLLYPDNVIAIRYPVDLPEFNDLDIATIKYLIEIMSDISVMSIAKEVDRVRSKRLGYPIDDRNFSLRLERLKSIYEKMKFAKELRDV